MTISTTIPVVHSVALLHTLKAEIQEVLKDFLSEPNESSKIKQEVEAPVRVHLYDMPDKNANPTELTVPDYPCVVIQPAPDFGKTLENENNLYNREISVDVLIYTMAIDRESRVEFNLNILNCLDQHFTTKDIVGNAFELKLPINLQSSDQTNKPHFATSLTLTYRYKSAWRETHYDRYE